MTDGLTVMCQTHHLFSTPLHYQLGLLVQGRFNHIDVYLFSTIYVTQQKPRFIRAGFVFTVFSSPVLLIMIAMQPQISDLVWWVVVLCCHTSTTSTSWLSLWVTLKPTHLSTECYALLCCYMIDWTQNIITHFTVALSTWEMTVLWNRTTVI